MIRLIYILLSFFFILGSTTTYAQYPGGIEGAITWKKDLKPVLRQAPYNSNAFNYNDYDHIANDGHVLELETKGLSRYTLFLVFNYNGGADFASIYTGSTKSMITDSSLLAGRKINFEEYDEHPKFICYKSSGEEGHLRNTESAKLVFGNFDFDRDMAEGGLAEVILYDRILNTEQIHKIETYLSLKYGISLPAGENYIDDEGSVIWNAKAHTDYSHELTGIGKNRSQGIDIRQSSNSKSGCQLEIGIHSIYPLNQLNPINIPDDNYIFWSNNGEPLSFKPIQHKEVTSLILDRKWKLSKRGLDIKNYPFQVKLNTDEIQDKDPLMDYYLIVGNDLASEFKLSNCKQFKMNQIGDQLVANQVIFDYSNNIPIYFTIMQSKPLIPEEAGDYKIAYQNPVAFDASFDINLTSNKPMQGNCMIHNMKGELVYYKKLDFQNKQQLTANINVAGSYLISLDLNGIKRSKPLIVQ